MSLMGHSLQRPSLTGFLGSLLGLGSGRFVVSEQTAFRRVFEHTHKIVRGFTSRYGVTMLVWFETYAIRLMRLRAKSRLRTAARLEVAAD
jgi:hypothetical protein